MWREGGGEKEEGPKCNVVSWIGHRDRKKTPVEKLMNLNKVFGLFEFQ